MRSVVRGAIVRVAIRATFPSAACSAVAELRPRVASSAAIRLSRDVARISDDQDQLRLRDAHAGALRAMTDPELSVSLQKEG